MKTKKILKFFLRKNSIFSIKSVIRPDIRYPAKSVSGTTLKLYIKRQIRLWNPVLVLLVMMYLLQGDQINMPMFFGTFKRDLSSVRTPLY